MQKLIELGIESGEYVEIDADFAHAAVDAIVVETHRLAARQNSIRADYGDCAASFLLRGLLSDPDRLPEIRAEAHRRIDSE